MTEGEEPPKKPEESPKEPFPLGSLESGPPSEMSYNDVTHCFMGLRSLSRKDVHTLHSYATFKMAGIRGVVFNADAKDLLQEAITRTLQGRRKWDPQKISFVTHLKGCMRSIASELLERAQMELEAMQESERNRRKDEHDNYPPEQILERVRSRLKDDVIALQVFDRLCQGDKRAEICKAFTMRANVYDAARKRISRCLYAIVEEWRRESEKSDRNDSDKRSEDNA